MHLLDELKRRNVIRVAIGYLAVGWLLLQAGSLIFGAFDLPNTWTRALLALVAIGFIPVLVLAWIYELTPEGLRRTSDVATDDSVTHLTGRKLDYIVIGVLAAVVALLLLDRFVVAPRQVARSATTGAVDNVAEGTAAGGASPTLGATSTAVLPFVNMSADKANEYFSDGMTETLLDRLAQVPQLKVAARTSSFGFKGTNTDVRRIAAALGVASIVEGSVQQAGDTLRITAQLIRAIDGAHLWSHNYDRKAADLFAIQDEIAGAVTEALVGELLPKTRAILAKGGTKDLAAYDAYTRGLEQIAINSFASNQQAVSLMQLALSRDPDYVDAMTGLVFSWLTMYRTGQIAAAEFRERAAPVIARIEALDAENASAFAFRAEIASQLGAEEDALRLARRAVAAAPSDIRLHVMASAIYGYLGDDAAGIAELTQAVALNPLDNNLIRFRATSLRFAGHLDEGHAAVLRALELDPKNSSNYWELSLNEQARGDLVGAIVHSIQGNALDPADPESGAVTALLLAEIGEPDAADAWIAESRRAAPDNLLAASAAVQAAYARGDAAAAIERALPLVARGAEEHHDFWRFAMIDACLAAHELGRTTTIRSALVEAHALPADLTADAFAAWKGAQVSATVRLRQMADLQACVFTADGADSTRRDALQALLAANFASGWETQDRWRVLAAGLRNNREAMLAEALPPRQTSLADLPLRTGYARLFGVADDARLKSHIADQHAEIDRLRTALPEALAKANVALLPSSSPPPPASSR